MLRLKILSRSIKPRWLLMKIFYSDRNVVAYNKLGIGRLIYQLPMPLCKMFIKEIFEEIPDDFDDETLATINKFFENNLSYQKLLGNYISTEIFLFLPLR